jgi:hypothetical protein
MDEVNVVWMGNRGVGKRTALHKALAAVATSRGLPFHIKKGLWSMNSTKKMIKESETSEAVEDSVETPEEDDKAIPYETSMVHLGFEISRMSMQDKNYIASLLERIGYNTEVATGKKKTNVKRIIVFYHAHLLSHDSVLQLQMALEQFEGSIVLWMTSELPLPYELSNWFVPYAVGGTDRVVEHYKMIYKDSGVELLDWGAYFQRLVGDWSRKPMNLARIQEIRDWVYFCLQRNLRWQEVIHYILESLLASGLPIPTIQAAVSVLTTMPASAGGQTLPSYRIPIAWEALGIGIASALAPALKSA